jgi:hypothetical protein
MAQLSRAFVEKNVVVIAGAPGMGKTRLAAEFARKSARETYDNICWISASSEAALTASLEGLGLEYAERLEYQSGLDLFDRVARTLSRTGRSLMILDGAPDLSFIQPYLKVASSLDILLTTSARVPDSMMIGGIGASGRVLDYIAAATKISMPEAELLLSAIDGSPLALHHACDYISRNSVNAEEYLLLLAKRSDMWTTRDLTPVDYEEPLLRAVQLSIERSLEEPSLRSIICTLACADAGPLPAAIIPLLAGNGHQAALSALRDQYAIQQDSVKNTLELHSLVRYAIRRRISTEDFARSKDALREALISLSDEATRKGLEGESATLLLAPHLLASDLRFTDLGVVAGLGDYVARLGFTLTSCRIRQKVYDCIVAYDDAASGIGSQAGDPEKPEVILLNYYRSMWATKLGVAFRQQGRAVDSIRIIEDELVLMNERGDIAARAPLLHELSHGYSLFLKRTEIAAELMRQSIAAYRSTHGGECDHASDTLACLVGSLQLLLLEKLGLYLDGRASDNVTPICEIVEEMCSAYAELVRIEDIQYSASGPSTEHSSHAEWTLVETLRLHANSIPADHECRISALARQEMIAIQKRVPAGISPTRARRGSEDEEELALAKLHARASEALESGSTSTLELADTAISQIHRIYGSASLRMLPLLSIKVDAAKQVDNHTLIGAAASKFMYICASIEDFDRAVSFSRRVLSSRESETEAIARLWERRFGKGPAASFLWLYSATTDNIGSTIDIHFIRRHARAVVKWGAQGAPVAGNLVHLLAHSTRTEEGRLALRCHRIAVGLLMNFESNAFSAGAALYCLAHRLLAEGNTKAAYHRFTQARRQLVIISGSQDNIVRHIDDHLKDLAR